MTAATATDAVPSEDAATPARKPFNVPAFSLVLLVGPSGSGKSTLARNRFRPGEAVSSDACRVQVGDGVDDLASTPLAFELLTTIVDLRLRARRLTVVDATNLREEDRTALRQIAFRNHALTVAIVLDPGEAACLARVTERGVPALPPADLSRVIGQQHAALRRTFGHIHKEGFTLVHVLGKGETDREIVRTRLWTDREDETGPFDLIGDVHGCNEELHSLLKALGWTVNPEGTRPRASHPEGRKAVFVGDLVDRGPDVGGVLGLVMDMVEDGTALCVAGNHEAKLERWLKGKKVRMTHGLDRSVAAIEAGGRDFRERVRRFVGTLVSHYMLDGGRLAVAHAGITENFQGRASGAVREFCLYGPTTGELDEEGLPFRGEWVPDYRGAARVVYGHTPVTKAEWVNNTLCLDTGCVFGGSLTALRYPEMETVSVPALETYQAPNRPFKDTGGASAQQADERDLDLSDFLGKRLVETGLMSRITVREENALAAVESMSRHAVDPRWLVHLPPTMSPCATASEPGYLEYPTEVFAQYRKDGVSRLVGEEKHMGSRAVLALCRSPEAAARRFGIEDGSVGEAWTKSGRPFFTVAADRDAFVARAVAACEASGLFDALGSDWVVLDAEIMPWSAKAMGLVRGQYAPVASAGRVGLGLVSEAMRAGIARGLDLSAPLQSMEQRLSTVEAFATEIRRYAPAYAAGDLRVAPFHVLASEGAVHRDKDHRWHLSMAGRPSSSDPMFVQTGSIEVDLSDPASEQAAVAHWLDVTSKGVEGMVFKPLDYVAQAKRGLVQPAVKCRGKAYLRIIYGPGYDEPENLERLRQRGLGAKRSLALREFALGIEGLERFVRGEPLRKVHECAFAIQALEAETVDPRL